MRRARTRSRACSTAAASATSSISSSSARAAAAGRARCSSATSTTSSASTTSSRDRTTIYRAEVTAQMLSTQDGRQMRAEGYLAAMLVLAEAVDLRDSGSSAHSETVGRYAEMIAAELGLGEQRVERVKLAGILHDIGKVGVPDEVLQK